MVISCFSVSSTSNNNDRSVVNVPNRTIQSNFINTRTLPHIPISSEIIHREPPPPYWVHHNHRRPVPIVAVDNSSTTSDSDNENLIGNTIPYIPYSNHN